METAGVYSQERDEILSASFEIRSLILKLQLHSVLLPCCSGPYGMPSVVACLGVPFAGKWCVSRQRKSRGTAIRPVAGKQTCGQSYMVSDSTRNDPVWKN